LVIVLPTPTATTPASNQVFAFAAVTPPAGISEMCEKGGKHGSCIIRADLGGEQLDDVRPFFGGFDDLGW
jgi:hypothetical protein